MGHFWSMCVLFAALFSNCGSRTANMEEAWRCPQFEDHPAVECSCDLPHTLRCTGDRSAMQIIGRTLRSLPTHRAVSLLDCTVQNVSALGGALLEGVALHGLVVSSGEIRDVHSSAFKGLAAPLQALGLPNNQLTTVPTEALAQLQGLDRLDLSYNKLKSLENNSFEGLSNLTFLELSDNQLTHLAPTCFHPLKTLSTLRLRGNNLNVPALAALKDLNSISELDLTKNALSGPLGPNTLPRLQSLHLLQMGHNGLTSVKRGALAGLINLTSLSLQHNQIDVIEDHAFRQLSNLTELDLAHNGIVAVSGNSLAHLVKLQKLDLSHNFLRALTADLVKPLQALTDLRLDDNDISIVAGDALSADVILDRFTLSENPLNCDCSLLEFTQWLQYSTHLSTADRSTSICTTPPNLEGALLLDLPPKRLICSAIDDDSTTTYVPDTMTTMLAAYTASLVAPVLPMSEGNGDLPISKSQLTLTDFQYDGSLVFLQWSVQADAMPYTCDAVFVYEEIGEHEVFLSSEPLHCDSNAVPNAVDLKITVPGSRDLKQGHKYRYCLVLLQRSKYSYVLTLVLGCSDIIPLHPTSGVGVHQKDPSVRVSGVRSNVTTNGTLSIEITLFGYPPNRPQNLEMSEDMEPSQEQITQYFEMLNNCYVSLAVFAQGSLIAQRDTPCDRTFVKMEGFLEGPYRVCASLSEFQVTGPSSRCVSAQKVGQLETVATIKGVNLVLIAACVGLISIIAILLWASRKLLKKPKQFNQPHQCFRADPQTCEDAAQHSRYVKLHATTKF
ncbi:leucine-rich tendon-specific protein [Arctopsyche grandis]|uniref:leucine-rich tendon-specific protein n=1 Tax=Arctopsyche grandis TaxID=121162 RepID=UPI00406D85C1